MSAHLRPFDPHDLEQVLALRELTFPDLDPARERRRWNWEFEENPFRRETTPLTWVLEDEGRIVGNFGMIPLEVKIGQDIHPAHDGIDLCLHPDYQGQGLANPLADGFMDAGVSAFPFVSAPVPATTHLIVRRGGKEIGARVESITWVSPPQEVETRTSLQVVDLETFDERADELWKRFASHYPLLIVRDSRYLNWRYRDFPFGRPDLLAVEQEGLLRGVAVVQLDPKLDRVYVLELIAEPDDKEVLEALLREAQRRTRLANLSTLALVTRDDRLHQGLRSMGFSELGGDIPAYAAKIHVPVEGVTVDDWYVSLGDGDALFGVGTYHE